MLNDLCRSGRDQAGVANDSLQVSFQGLYADDGWSLKANMTGKKEFWSAADQKKKPKTVSQTWRPVYMHASPSEGMWNLYYNSI
ncbi:hypothetical protein SDJN02_12318 [Cucurbita argyrosperma subsp. argyrosperma]|nr:hypothetical protein SDJN02_12318 [Cucurbita argyrosperma subsp. argyrosperma]